VKKAETIEKIEKVQEIKKWIYRQICRRFYLGAIVLNNYRAIIIAGIFLISFSWGLYLYLGICGENWIRAIRYTVLLYIDAIPLNDEDDISSSLELASILAKSSLFFAVIIWFIKSKLASFNRFCMAWMGGHTLVIGLDRNSRFFIDSELKKGERSILVVENDEFNPYIEIYRNLAIPVLSAEIEQVMEKIGIHSAQYIFVSTGDSRENIATTLKILEYAKFESDRKLLVHIEDRTLRSLYNDESLLGRKKLNIQPFSFHKESARMLFEEHDIDGEGIELINSSEDLEIVVVGESNLAIEVIVEAIKMSHFPNQNRLVIHCIAQDIEAFQQRVEYEIPYIDAVDHLEINYISLDYNSRKFYEESIWHQSTLKHIILTAPKSVSNINIATKLKRLTYGNRLENLGLKIHIATYSDVALAKEIRQYHESKRNRMYVFASADRVCASENLMDTPLEKFAKLIDYGHGLKVYQPHALEAFCDVMKKAWRGDISINDKRSSLAQAKHIKVKLKSLGLEMRGGSAYTLLERINRNQAIFQAKLHADRAYLKLDDATIEQLRQALNKYYAKEHYQTLFFPQEYHTRLEKLLRAEHNRWIAMLIMMDNHYDPEAKMMPPDERKITKVHHLLKPFEAFEEDEKVFIVNDLLSVLYIPHYLACVGYDIVPLNSEERRDDA